MSAFRRVCVFCGSSAGSQPSYAEAARDLGRVIGARGLGLVYGGAGRGLMGVLADAALEAGAAVVGVIPRAMVEREIAHLGLSELRVVGSMHERKAQMADLADAFVAMPGGLGTLEEFCEVVTWAQLGLHSKPCALLNVDGYFDPFIEFLDHMVEHRFVKPAHRAIIFADADIEGLLDRVSATIDA